MGHGIGARIEALAAGRVGDRLPSHAALFGEDQGRYLLAVPPERLDAVLARATAAGVPAVELGETGGDALILPVRAFGPYLSCL